jgi:hypothetical protein
MTDSCHPEATFGCPISRALFAREVGMLTFPILSTICHLERSMQMSKANRHAQSKDPYHIEYPSGFGCPILLSRFVRKRVGTLTFRVLYERR